jgi:hypothetical protein
MLDFRLAEFRLRVFERTQRIVGAQLLAQGEYPYFGTFINPSKSGIPFGLLAVSRDLN